VVWCSSTRKLSQLPSCPFFVAGALVCSVTLIRDLRVFIDSDLGAAIHVQRTVPLFRCTLPASFITSVVTSPTTASVPWWCSLCSQDSTMAIFPDRGSSLSAGAPPVCSQRRAWSDVSSFDYVVTTMSRMPLQLCTDCVYHSVLTSRWLSWRSAC